MAVHLSQIVPWGRTRDEYTRMFSLTVDDLSRGILDCGGGPASFTAEVTADEHRAVSVDPVYAFSEEEIRARFNATAEPMIAQVRATHDTWNWSYHRDPEGLLANRRAALEGFLADYDRGRREQRYIVAELPTLPFKASSFGLALSSHLLFLYSDLLSEDFHVKSVKELCRVANEVRIFPLLTLAHKPSPRSPAVRAALRAAGIESEVQKVNFEFQKGGNQMLRFFKP